MVWETLFSLLDSIQACTMRAPEQTVESTAPGILVHHSRNTAAKQWDETRAIALSGVAKVCVCVYYVCMYVLCTMYVYVRARVVDWAGLRCQSAD
jgi:hypothetical protein